uniref:RILP-like protein 2 n=1 Tax=Tetraodon nigroviridis TaxID=99883 RepID=H3DEH0_TETNG
METCAFTPLDRPATELTTVDVYDIAAVLGHELERVMDRFGCEPLVGLVHKVVRVLELLEALVSRGAAAQEADELRTELDRLRQERSQRRRQDRRHQEELESVEDVWRGEVQQLLSQISQLQAENRRLLQTLPPSQPPVLEEDSENQEGMLEKERQIVKKLQDLVEKQRDEIRAKDHELASRSEDVEALQMQQARLMRVNQDLRHRMGAMEARGKALIQRQAELEAAAQAQQQEVGTLQREVARLRQELDRGVAGVLPASLTAPGPPAEVESRTTEEPPEEDQDVLEEEWDQARFTLQELRDVLHERNELKAQVFVLQEELTYYKSEELEDDVGSRSFCAPTPPPCSTSAPPESGIRRLIFTAIMPMVAAGLIADDPTLLPIRRLLSSV